MEKKTRKVIENLVFFVLIILVFVAFFLKPTSPFYKADCLKDDCKQGFVCIKSKVDAICVDRNFYNKYWTIFNLYNYNPCKLTIMGNTDINFFTMTLGQVSKKMTNSP